MSDWTHRLRGLARRRERGQIAVAIMLGFVLLFMLTAFGFDMGAFYVDHRMAQGQAEAAALAAVDKLPASDSTGTRAAAIAAANTSLSENGSDSSQRLCPTDNSDAVNIFATGPFDTFNPAGQLNTVRVCVRRPSTAVFSQLARVKSVMVSAAAAAVVRMVPLQYALMAMDSSCNASGNLTISGGANVVLQAPSTPTPTPSGGTYTNATNCGGSLNVSGSGSSLTDAVNSVTSGSSCSSGSGTLTPACTQQDFIPDPYANAQPLIQSPCNTFVDNVDGATNVPRRYCNNININSGDTIYLDCSSTTRANCFFTFTGTFRINNGSRLLYKPSVIGTNTIAQDSTSQGATGGTTATSIQWSHTVANQAGRMLLVGVVTQGSTTVSGVTYGTQAMTQVGTTTGGTGGGTVRTTLFSLARPAVGTNAIKVTASAATNMVGMAVGYYNVASLGNNKTGSKNASSSSSSYSDPSLASAAGQVVVDMVGTNSTANLAATGAGQTALFATGVKSSVNGGNMSTKAGAASVAMAWSASAGTPDWASVAVAMVPLPITNPGITLYFTCDPSPCNGASAPAINWSGNGMAIGNDGNPLLGNPDWNSMLIWVDNTASSSTININGGAQVDLSGRIYAIKSNTTFTGNAGETVDLNLNIIANDIKFTGENDFILDWDPEFAPAIRRVSLIE